MLSAGYGGPAVALAKAGRAQGSRRMADERLSDVLRIYEAALAREGAARGAYLDAECGADTELRREVEALLVEPSVGSHSPLDTPPAAQPAIKIGQHLGPYKILAPIGAGGMGEVYKARDTRLDCTVAIKVLPAGLATDPERRHRFEQEARAAAALNHPHICALKNVGAQDGIDFLVMEYLDGQTLAARLRKGPLPLAQALELGAQVADALAAAHRHHIVHRDLKPGNIMLVKVGAALQAKLLDFGLAKLRAERDPGVALSSAPTEAPMTAYGAVMGTVPYMAPEQLEGKETDARTDIFALGCVLFELLTGRRAFEGTTKADLTAAILEHDPPPVSALRPATPHALDRLVRRCLAKDPDDRWQDAADVAEELRGISEDAGAPVPKPTVPPRRRTSRLAWAALAAAIVMAAGAGGWVWKLESTPPGIRSLAVLPLKNLIGDPQQEYFVDGMTEGLTTAIARISALTVISQTSAATFKNSKRPLPAIARDLGVDGVIEGSVRRVGKRVRITVKLIQAKIDKLIWEDDYDRDLSDILVLQDEVAGRVAREIQVKLTPEEQARLARARPVNPDAHLAYLQGRQAMQAQTQETLRNALTYFERAAQIDPDYAPAYTGMADVYFGFSNIYLSPREAMPKAEAAASKALQLDESLADAHASLALALMTYRLDFKGAEQHLRRAITLDRNSVLAHRAYGFLLANLGKFDEVGREVEQARKLDPLSVFDQVYSCLPLYFARRYEEAARNWEDSAVAHPDDYLVHAFLGLVYEQQPGKLPEAVTQFERAVYLEKNSSEPKAQLAHAYAMAGRKAEARKLLVDLTNNATHQYVAPYNIALIHLSLGESGQALQWLEKSFEDRSEWNQYFNVDPRLDPLRSDPRFKNLLRRMKLPEVMEP